MAPPVILLASASPRRSELLRQVGVAHEVRPVDIDEAVQPGEAPSAYVLRLDEAKADALWQRLPAGDRRPVLAADTTVALEGEINQLAGVVTVGLFARRPADVLLVGTASGVVTLARDA